MPRFLLAAAILLSCTPENSAKAGPILDQSYTQQDGYYGPGPFSPQAQTFTVGITGLLTEVDLRISTAPTPNPNPSPIIVEINSLLNGFPAAGSLAAVSVPYASLPTGAPGDFVALDFTHQNLQVFAGEMLAITIRTTDDGANLEFGRTLDVGDMPVGGYDGGRAFTGEIGNVWFPLPQGDQGFPNSVAWNYDFKTFVSPVPVPPTLPLFAVGSLIMVGWSIAQATRNAASDPLFRAHFRA